MPCCALPVTRRRRSPVLLSLCLLLAALLHPPAAAANAPPEMPVIENPQHENVIPTDVHLEVRPRFGDLDGDTHQATDWEIRTSDGATIVWAAHNSAELVHAHFSDGAFQGAFAGATHLDFNAAYLVRVRFQDSRGAWSEWAERVFTTVQRVEIPPRQVRGIVPRPAPRWQSDGGASIGLPAGARLMLETASGAALLTLAGTEAGMTATAGAILAAPEVLRLHLVAPGATGVRLPASRLAVVADHAERLTVYLPALTLAPGQAQVLWVSQTGATFYGAPEQTAFDRSRLARDMVLPWAVEPGYRLEAVSATYQLPASLAFVPDPGTDPAAPRFYATELPGRIKVVTNDGRVFNFAENLLNFTPNEHFAGSGELGVVGVCLAPDSHDVYATTTYADPQGILRNKVVRIRSSDGLTADGLDEILVARLGQGTARSSHQIQQCSFGPDGKLYVFVADGRNPDDAQRDRFFNGKVLRLNPDGTAPPDNPFYDPADPTAPISYQYTKGHRNAFGMTWRPSTGQLYLSENGPSVDRLVHIVPGRNYGWDGTDESMRTHALYVWPEAHWSPVGLTFVEGPHAGAFPPDKHGHLFVGAAGPVYAQGPQPAGKAIQEFVLDADGAIARAPTLFARYVGEGRGSITDLKLQPDGLYFTDLFQDDGEGGPTAPGGKVWRIRYTGQAGFTPSVRSGPAPLTVAFADTSTLTGGVSWAWDFGDGATSGEPSPSHTFGQPGRYAVSLTVTAADGTTSEALTLVTVADAAGQVPDPAVTPLDLPAQPAPASVSFPETGMGIGGGFKYFWEQHGGLAQFGYPLTNEFQERNPADGQEYTVQYFERARFEYHPEHAGTPYETELGLLGRQLVEPRAGEAAFQPVADPGAGAWFPETGHTLADAFRSHWQATGGTAIYGLPISEPLAEVSPVDGQAYLVQYFERARLEHHPAAAGAVDEVQLARLGTILFVRQPAPR